MLIIVNLLVVTNSSCMAYICVAMSACGVTCMYSRLAKFQPKLMTGLQRAQVKYSTEVAKMKCF